MPITLTQIKTLQHISNANFRKHECQNCKNEFYSIREAKWCCGACKQAGHRQKQLRDNVKQDEAQSIATTIKEEPTPSKTISKTLETLKQKENYFKQLTN